MRPSIEGKVIVITGASSGIGEAAARRLAYHGARVCMIARRAHELERVQREIEQSGGEAFSYPADLGDSAALQASVDRILEQHGHVDVLVNNAGRSIRRLVRESVDRFHDYERLIQLNYLAAVKLTLALLPSMLERRSGQIINVSSMSTLMPMPRFSAYVSSKCALEGFSRSLAAELVDEGIAVTVINYPLVRTPMSAPTAVYRYLRQMDPGEAADWIMRAIEKRPLRIASHLGEAWGLATMAMPQAATEWTGRLFKAVGKRLEARARRDAVATEQAAE